MLFGSKSSDNSPGRGPLASTRPRARITGWKKWALRIGLVVLGPALVIGLLEGVLGLLNYGHAASYWIASKDGDVYRSNPDFGIRFFGRDLNRSVVPAAISPTKPDNTYRIFVFGGSTAFGTPDPAFSFVRILEAILSDRFTGTRFEVVNTAMTAINSHVVYEIARDCRHFDGDLYIVYMGNNEVVGPYGPGTALIGYNPALWAIRMNASLKATRSGQLIANVFGGARGPKEWRGMEMFLENRVTADDPRLESMYENFRTNLRDICREAHEAGAEVIVSTIITNLKDLPPFASVHRAGLSADDKERWDALYNEGIALQKAGDHAGALQRYEAAEQIDDRFAELHFRMARRFLELKQVDRARARFIQARDLDALRFRADTRINQIIRATAGELASRGVHLVDAANTVSGKGAPGGIHGSELLYEHVHPTFEGNYALAVAMFRKVVALLPPSVREDAASVPDPPSLERCAEFVVFTPYARYSNMELMLEVTGHPPFPEERRARDAAEVRRLKALVTPGLLADVAKSYRERLRVRPDDVLLRMGFAGLEYARREYASAAEQYKEALRLFPDDPKTHNNLGTALQGLGRFEEAISHYEKALRLKPDSAKAHHNLGSALLGLRRFEEAVSHYEKALRLKPDNAEAHHNRGLAYQALGKLDLALEDYTRAIELRPDYASAYNNRGVIYQRVGKLELALSNFARGIELKPDYAMACANRGVTYRMLGKPQLALKDLSRAIELKLDQALIYYNRGKTYAELGENDLALKDYARAIMLQPNYPGAHHDRAMVYAALGQYGRAISGFAKALELKPSFEGGHNNLAWILATCPDATCRDAKKAVASATRACELSGWKFFSPLDTLAAAYAESGEFAEAVKWQAKAVELAPAGAKAELRSRLELYKARKPYRETPKK